MSATLIKNFFVFLCCIYIHHRLLGRKTESAAERAATLAVSLTLSLCVCLTQMFTSAFDILLPLVLLWLFLGYTTSRPQVSFVAMMLSYGISYSMFTLCIFIVLIFLAPMYYPVLSVTNLPLILCAGLMEVLLLHFLFRVRRFKSGMPFLSSTKAVNIGTLCSLLPLALLLYGRLADTFSLPAMALILFLAISTILIIMRWWQTQLTNAYRKKLQALETESMREQLRAAEQRLQEVQRQNEEMGRLIHRDNKLIPAMEQAVLDFLATGNDAAQAQHGRLLIEELHALSHNRQQTLSAISAIRSRDFNTGIVSLDALLSYMDKRARSLHIAFTVHISEAAGEQILDFMSADHLTHLLADLIENALFATRRGAAGSIRLQVYLHQEHLCIDVSDNGIPFAIDPLLHFGIRPATTHSHDGGSGIGLMDIWKIKKTYGASVHITEYRQPAPLTKKITFLCDRKDRYLIYSWRHTELAALSQRTDLDMLPIGEDAPTGAEETES